MYNRKHKLPASLFIVCIIALLGFKDTGIFVKDFVGVKDQGGQTQFVKEGNIQIVNERKNDYIVVKENTEITNETYGNVVDLLNIGEEVQALKLDQGYGLFQTKDGIKGHIDLKNLEKTIEEPITHGISKVNKVIKIDKKIYTLVKGETVAIKNFEKGSYIAIDDKGNEFTIDEKYIEIRRTREKPTRGSSSTRARDINKVVNAAYEALGTKYVYAGTTSNGYDCSGLTFGIYSNNLDIELPRTSSGQSAAGMTVAKDDLIPGDLIFFKTTSAPVGHVGIYIGDNNMIHASTSQRRVIISDINSTYYRTRYVNSKRIIE